MEVLRHALSSREVATVIAEVVRVMIGRLKRGMFIGREGTQLEVIMDKQMGIGVARDPPA
jgi:hypothetical protein